MIIQKLAKFDFSKADFSAVTEYPCLRDGFLLQVVLKKLPKDETREIVLDIPGSLCISARRVYKSKLAEMTTYEKNENYFVGFENCSSVAVLEARFCFENEYRPDWKAMQIGIPITEKDLNTPLVIGYNKVWMRFFKDGLVLNENYTAGSIKAQTSPAFVADSAEVLISYTINDIPRTVVEHKIKNSANYYMPSGRNSFAGDAVTYWHNGVYHLLYLYDRHHHGNRWYGGAHFFCQLTTRDFINWVDEGPLFEFDADWQCGGTGTMFYFENKYYLAFGLHTNRTVPRELTEGVYRRDVDYPDRSYTCAVPYDKIFEAGRFPSGSNLAVSDDGIHFKNLHLQYHWEVNPSVFSLDDGSLLMCCGSGMWKSKRPEGEWTIVSAGFPPHELPPMYNSMECPSLFEKNGYKYIIVGVTGFWRTEKDSDEYYDSAALGFDVYEGLVVPMACNCGGRLMYAGWLSGFGWASALVQRELIQYDDGRLGMKWIEELSPDRKGLQKVWDGVGEFSYPLPQNACKYIEIDITPADDARVALLFCSESEETKGCELQLDFKKEQAQYAYIEGEDFAPSLPPMHKAVRQYEQTGKGAQLKPQELPNRSLNFSIANVDVMKKPFTLRVILHSSEKLGSCIIDAEINKARTLVTNRVGLEVSHITAKTENSAVITEIRICDAEHDPIIYP